MSAELEPVDPYEWLKGHGWPLTSCSQPVGDWDDEEQAGPQYLGSGDLLRQGSPADRDRPAEQ
ncbi:hypothetical protein ACFC1R_32365 [Kitasatospora sp. NPDC056138]|uniref:hypothetical protein n=1 Tax=Kitasatospora sp. NPDC056138 TaxID=3345724 RepID=UPI0035D63C33